MPSPSSTTATATALGVVQSVPGPNDHARQENNLGADGKPDPGTSRARSPSRRKTGRRSPSGARQGHQRGTWPNPGASTAQRPGASCATATLTRTTHPGTRPCGTGSTRRAEVQGHSICHVTHGDGRWRPAATGRRPEDGVSAQIASSDAPPRGVTPLRGTGFQPVELHDRLEACPTNLRPVPAYLPAFNSLDEPVVLGALEHRLRVGSTRPVGTTSASAARSWPTARVVYSGRGRASAPVQALIQVAERQAAAPPVRELEVVLLASRQLLHLRRPVPPPPRRPAGAAPGRNSVPPAPRTAPNWRCGCRASPPRPCFANSLLVAHRLIQRRQGVLPASAASSTAVSSRHGRAAVRARGSRRGRPARRPPAPAAPCGGRFCLSGRPSRPCSIPRSRYRLGQVGRYSATSACTFWISPAAPPRPGYAFSPLHCPCVCSR